MHCDNGFELLIVVVFVMSPQLGGIWSKAQDLVITFFLGEGEPLPDFHLRALTIRIKLELIRYQTGQINNITGKYIMGLSKLKHIHQYTTSHDIDYRRFERQPQSEQLPLKFTPKTEKIFETLETADIDMNPPHSMIEPIVNRNFGNKFQHQNGPNQHHQTHKNTSKQYQHRNTRQQY